MKTNMNKLFLFIIITVLSLVFFTGCKPGEKLEGKAGFKSGCSKSGCSKSGCSKKGFKKKYALILDHITSELELTETQKHKLESIKNDVMIKLEKMHEEKDKMHIVLKEQLASETLDKAVIKKLYTDHHQRMDKVFDYAIDRLIVFHKELTTDQKKKLINTIEKFEKFHCKR